MLVATFLVAALVGSGHFLGAQGQACKLTLQTDLDSTKEPLVLAVKTTQIRGRQKVEQLEIARPEVEKREGVITIDETQSLIVACPGPRNNNRGSGEQSAYVKCKGGKLTVGNRPATKETLSCTNSVAYSSVMVTDDTCGSGDDTGVIVQLGYQLDDKSWFPLIDVCHNIERSVTLYAAHYLYGQSLKGAVKSNDRRKFSRGPKVLFPNVSPDSVYTRKGQEKAFDRILGDDGHKLYINNTSFLARGHLAPDADFIYNSGQLLTYYYVNVAGQWQNFNAGNWLIIENAVRDLAVKVDETLRVFTGTYGILKLTNSNGDQRMIYLEPTKKLIAVPEVYWKLVQHPVTKSCTVVVGSNNVFLTQPPTPICSTATPEGWPTLTNLAKGYVYYCDYDSFKKTVPYVPDVDCKDLFEFPEKNK
ncbi:uncharacterized protein LOC124359179 [Homalodisca vitripennis]|uniref:uncharacterized protein LOC124359179 n=1 Tax=Homalodisca vitripennis TaxID=197043 RepID=UPI001EEC168C|nr:uncharacterized protein LOC124359179 [Homalodisca vitripennis]